MTRDLDNFRVLIVLALATLGFALYVSMNAAPPPDDLLYIYGWHGFGSVTPGVIEPYWYWIELALYAVGLVGMFFFVPYSRLIILIAMFSTPARGGLGGIWVISPFEAALWSFHGIFFMFAVGMAFFHPPVVAEFQRYRSERGTSDATGAGS